MARSIVIVYDQEPEGWRARTNDIKNYVAGGESLEDLRYRIHTELPEFLGEELIITEILSTYQKTA
ncbi:MAG: hypothetical protein AB2L14_01230 [Candidatus Xenobiia bacterium LiM19]